MAEQTGSTMRDKRGTAESQGKGKVSFVVLLDILSVVLAVVSSVVLLAATALSASSTASSAAVGIVLSVLCCFIAIHRSRSRESKPQIAIAPAFCNSKLDRAATKAGKASKNGWNMRGMGARRTRNAGRIGGRRAETSASRNKNRRLSNLRFSGSIQTSHRGITVLRKKTITLDGQDDCTGRIAL